MTLHAITVLGHDRPGIIAEATDKLAGLGLNLEDSTMTLLRGHFAMTLICEGDATDEPEGLFGPVVPVPDDAPPFDRLLGQTGRDPAWAAR